MFVAIRVRSDRWSPVPTSQKRLSTLGTFPRENASWWQKSYVTGLHHLLSRWMRTECIFLDKHNETLQMLWEFPLCITFVYFHIISGIRLTLTDRTHCGLRNDTSFRDFQVNFYIYWDKKMRKVNERYSLLEHIVSHWILSTTIVEVATGASRLFKYIEKAASPGDYLWGWLVVEATSVKIWKKVDWRMHRSDYIWFLLDSMGSKVMDTMMSRVAVRCSLEIHRDSFGRIFDLVSSCRHWPMEGQADSPSDRCSVGMIERYLPMDWLQLPVSNLRSQSLEQEGEPHPLPSTFPWHWKREADHLRC